MTPAQILVRVDKMLAAGRITEDDATRLRAAAETGVGLDDAVKAVRSKHVRAKVDDAIDDGRLTAEEADSVVDEVEHGHMARLRRALRRPHA